MFSLFERKQRHSLSGPMAEAITKTQLDRQGLDKDAEEVQALDDIISRANGLSSGSEPYTLGWSRQHRDRKSLTPAVLQTSLRPLDRTLASSSIPSHMVVSALSSSTSSSSGCIVAPLYEPDEGISFDEAEYEALGLDSDIYQPITPLFGHRLTFDETNALFAYCATYGPSNMVVVADRMQRQFAAAAADHSAEKYSVPCCSYRYYACARAILQGRLEQLKAASTNAPPTLGASISVLVTALSQHPLLAAPPPLTIPSARSSSKFVDKDLLSPAAPLLPYYGSLQGATAYEARLRAASPLDPPALLPPSDSGYSSSSAMSKPLTVMQYKAMRVYRALEAAVEHCHKRAEEEPSMDLLIASIEDKATVQLERVLEGVRDGVRAPNANGVGSVVVSESPYTIGAPDLASSEHMLLTLSTTAHRSALAKKKSSSMTQAPLPTQPSPPNKKAAGKRVREEISEDGNALVNASGGAVEPAANYLSQLLLLSQEAGGTSPHAPLSPNASGINNSYAASLMTSPALPIPTPLHLELEDKLEETLIGDPLALACTCTACRAAMDVVRSRLMRCVLLRRALSRTNSTLGLAQKLCLDELAPVLGAYSLEAAVIARDTNVEPKM